MAESSKIQWTHATFNPWRGCTKVSEGCAHCYAEQMSGRNPAVLGTWGPNGARVVAAESYWRGPLRWDAEAVLAGERRRVFCASLADVFEGWDTMPESAREPVRAARVRLFHLIHETPNLDWLLLTKRPENVRRFCDQPGRSWSEYTPPNVWIGTSVENQARLEERAPHLLRVPARVRFLSAEPLLGPLDLRPFIGPGYVQWVIVGGESGPGARPFDPHWARIIVDQCKDAGVPVFVKQLGENVTTHAGLRLRNKGGDWDDLPNDLRVREFPA